MAVAVKSEGCGAGGSEQAGSMLLAGDAGEDSATEVDVAASSSDEGERVAAFDIKGAVSTLTVLRLRCAEMDAVRGELERKISPMPQFFKDAPVIVDLELLEGDGAGEVDMRELVSTLRQYRLVPVAVRALAEERMAEALAAGLGRFGGELTAHHRLTSGRNGAGSTKMAGAAPQVSQPSAESTAADRLESMRAAEAVNAEVESGGTATLSGPSKVVTQPIRAGQIVYAQNADLVLLAPVNAGAEVIADGNIHAYAALRGRALAGAHGDEAVRIFCSSLEAELVSIAGNYLMADEINDDLRRTRVQVHLEKGEVRISPL